VMTMVRGRHLARYVGYDAYLASGASAQYGDKMWSVQPPESAPAGPGKVNGATRSPSPPPPTAPPSQAPPPNAVLTGPAPHSTRPSPRPRPRPTKPASEQES
jgi:hypothetical protein